MPVPTPNVHDEFSYLLAGDTFAHGRLTNPPHPMREFFETFHVLQQPTYSSMYPPAQGMALALGEFLGQPWLGVLLSAGIMCGAILWALQGWLPSRWALLGGILAALRVGVVSYWVNSYWGGTMAAIGGALVIGALPRIWRCPRFRYALIMGLGATVLANSRPLEGFIFCVPVAVSLAAWFFSLNPLPRRRAALHVALTLFLGAVALLALLGYYNWRVTRDPLLPPELLDARVYNNYPVFLWQARKPQQHYLNPEFERFYYAVGTNSMPISLFRSFLDKTNTIFDFFLGTSLSIALLGLPRMLEDRRTRLLLIQLAISFFGAVAVVWSFLHYFAASTAAIFILVVLMLRLVRQWSLRSCPV